MRSASALREADFVFSHVFDVQSYTLSERFPDTIYKRRVEFFFNKNAQESIHSKPNIVGREEASGTKLLPNKELGKCVANAGTSGTVNSLPKENAEELSGRDDSLAVVSQSKRLKIKLKKYGSQDVHGEKIKTEHLQMPGSETQPVKRRKLLENVYDDDAEDEAVPVLPKEEQLENPSDSLRGKLEYKDEVPKLVLVLSTRTLTEDIEALEYDLVKDTTMENKVAATMRRPDNDLDHGKGISSTKNLSPVNAEASGDKASHNALDKDAMENKDVALYRRTGATMDFGGVSPKEKLSDTVSLHAGHGVNDLKAPACARDKEVKIRRIVQEVTSRPSAVSVFLIEG